MKNVIFVGGIHGVGKSSLCRLVCQKLNIEYLSASGIINEVSKEPNYVRNKVVADVDGNQQALIKGINRRIKKDKQYILDGHFVLIKADETVGDVPIKVFDFLHLKAVIVIVDEEERIRKRLLERDGKHYRLELLKRMQNLEIRCALKVSERLGIPVFKCLAGDEIRFNYSLGEIIHESSI